MSALIQTSFTPSDLSLSSLPFTSYYHYSFTKQPPLIRFPTLPLTSISHCQISKQNVANLSAQGTTTTTTPTKTTTRKPVAMYLTERLSYSEEDSLAISKKLVRHRDNPRAKKVTDLISFENADIVITFLNQHCGINLSHIKKIITMYPRLLGANLDKTIKPKIKLLQDLGFSTSDLAHVLSRNPYFYLSSDLTPAIQFLRDFMGSDEYVVKFFRRLSRASSTPITINLIPNVTMMENEYGVPRDKLRKFLRQQPCVFMLKTDTLRDGIVKVEGKWGITRDSADFLRAVRVFCGFSEENIDSKCRVFKSFGWSQSDIMMFIRKCPTCLGCSEARIKKALEFYMNVLGYSPAYLISRPTLINYSLENRVMPRQRVLSVLKEKGLLKADYQLSSCINFSDEKFFDKFISPYDNVVPELREVYINDRVPSEAQLHMEASEN